MGEAKRRKLAGYAPEPKVQKSKPSRIAVIGHGGMGKLAMMSALLSMYPSLPKIERNEDE